MTSTSSSGSAAVLRLLSDLKHISSGAIEVRVIALDSTRPRHARDLAGVQRRLARRSCGDAHRMNRFRARNGAS